jgi:aryl-phospho-beta-D-glucosidase BglC (GH1 family)
MHLRFVPVFRSAFFATPMDNAYLSITFDTSKPARIGLLDNGFLAILVVFRSALGEKGDFRLFTFLNDMRRQVINRIFGRSARAAISLVAFWASLGFLHGAVGYLHTTGSQIWDSDNNPVRLTGVNWYGFETTWLVVGGLQVQDYHAILNTIKNNGYNVIRIPFSNQMIESPIVPTRISTTSINTDLAGLNSIQILDKIVAAAAKLGLRIILDNHRSEAGSSAEANGLWYTSAYPENAWINDWVALAARYNNNAAVIGMDLRNEPHNATSGGSCWGCGTTAYDWRLAAERAGNSILAVNPNLLIFVEGTDCYNGDCTWWGGNLEGVQNFPVLLNVPNRVVYSAHDYGPNLYTQGWFNSGTTYSSLVSLWTKWWGYISLNHIAPLWVGEFGTTNNNSDITGTTAGSQGQWFQSLITFLRSYPEISWTYWALDGEDSYALLDSNYDSTPANPLKQSLLASIQSQPLAQVIPCDFNGDGKVDLFIYDPATGNAYTALSVGSGGFTYIYTPATPGFDTIRYGDMNGDGKTDLIVYNSSTALGYTLLSNGTGTFTGVSLFWGPGFHRVAAGDLNGDGLTDFLIYRSTDGTSYTALSNGDGTFRYKYTLVSPGFTHMQVADFSGDGKADVVYYNSATGAAFLGISDGAGGFSFSPVALSPAYDAVEAGDIDGDGKSDLLLYASSNGTSTVGLSTGSGFALTTTVWTPGFTNVRMFDFNGDGLADVALYNRSNALAYLLVGSGTASFTSYSLFWPPGLDNISIGDFNGDGKQDVLIYSSASAAAYTGISTGNPANPFTYQYSFWGSGRLLDAAAAEP